MQAWALVTPASRGIGLEIARRLLKTTNIPLVATARKDPDQTRENILTGLDGIEQDRLNVLKVDVLGLLFPEKSPTQISYDDALLTFRTNTLGPMMLLKHFSPLLPRKSTQLATTDGLPPQAVWATLSARVGSISDNNLGGWYSYRASKAAVNQITKTFDNHLKSSAGDKAMAISLHPGTVKTGLSKEFWANVKKEKLFEADFAAEKLVQVVNGRQTEDRGRCWDWKGEEVPP
ncbi:hypothetical protein LTR66_010475 [Elasticomyces elasticus]|nr:hypothetical protein LTR66_010475 [Elasticomyces elasticus]